MRRNIIDQEDALLIKLQQGDVRAFEKLYNNYKQPLAINFLRLLRNDDLAQDALQDLFVRVWNNRAAIDPSLPFKSYLYKIAQNLVIDCYRKIARDKRLMEEFTQQSVGLFFNLEAKLEHKETRALRQDVIDRLPAQQRRTYTLHKVEGKSYQEIANIMGISRSTINKHIYFANKFIKQELNASPWIFQGISLAILLNL